VCLDALNVHHFGSLEGQAKVGASLQSDKWDFGYFKTTGWMRNCKGGITFYKDSEMDTFYKLTSTGFEGRIHIYKDVEFVDGDKVQTTDEGLGAQTFVRLKDFPLKLTPGCEESDGKRVYSRSLKTITPGFFPPGDAETETVLDYVEIMSSASTKEAGTSRNPNLMMCAFPSVIQRDLTKATATSDSLVVTTTYNKLFSIIDSNAAHTLSGPIAHAAFLNAPAAESGEKRIVFNFDGHTDIANDGLLACQKWGQVVNADYYITMYSGLPKIYKLTTKVSPLAWQKLSKTVTPIDLSMEEDWMEICPDQVCKTMRTEGSKTKGQLGRQGRVNIKKWPAVLDALLIAATGADLTVGQYYISYDRDLAKGSNTPWGDVAQAYTETEVVALIKKTIDHFKKDGAQLVGFDVTGMPQQAWSEGAIKDCQASHAADLVSAVTNVKLLAEFARDSETSEKKRLIKKPEVLEVLEASDCPPCKLNQKCCKKKNTSYGGQCIAPIVWNSNPDCK